MTGDKEAFSSLALFIGGGVMFGSRDKSQITGKCDVKIPGLPKLENVCYVDGLKSNLISISQLCDDVVDEMYFKKKRVVGLWMNMERTCLFSRDLETITTFLMSLKFLNTLSATKLLMKLVYYGIRDLGM
ncbi:hypothetical protein ACFX2J_013126 [Malus domestica]